jgi:hydrogenase nickel incorporation protein HypA/HybF
MHELSLIQSVVEICSGYAAGRRVTAVTLEVGELSGVVPEALEFCFPSCAAETLLAGATLTIERVPGRGRCLCGTEFAMEALYAACPACGGYGAALVAGGELRVKELEVD